MAQRHFWFTDMIRGMYAAHMHATCVCESTLMHKTMLRDTQHTRNIDVALSCCCELVPLRVFLFLQQARIEIATGYSDAMLGLQRGVQHAFLVHTVSDVSRKRLSQHIFSTNAEICQNCVT